MNKKEISEIKKAISSTRCTISRIAGCIVNTDKDINSLFEKNFLNQNEEEIFSYLDLFKKGLSGKIDQKLFNLEFPTKDKSKYSNKLCTILSTQLKNNQVLLDFYKTITDNYKCLSEYVILVAYGNYDVPSKNNSIKTNSIEECDSESVYEYMICMICPLILDKAALSYNNNKNDIEYKIRNQLIGSPMTSFLYPAFDDRATNKNAMLYYSKKTNELQESFLENVFNITSISSMDKQKNVIATAMETVDVSMDNIFLLKEKSSELAEDQKLNSKELEKICDQCEIQANGISDILDQEGIREINLGNVINSEKTTIKTDNVNIQLNNEFLEKITIRKIDGIDYILIKPDGRILVDGIPVRSS